MGENSPRQITNVLKDLFIKYINAGDASSSCVTHDRIVYMWGSGLHGRLGNGNSNNLLKPELSQELKDKQVKLMFKGTNTSFALLESTSILAWGSSKNGKLGFSMGNGKNYELPKEIITINEQGIEVYQIAAGPFHTLLLSTSGKIYCMGSSKDGKLGIDMGASICDCDRPTLVKFPSLFFKNQVA